MRTCGTGWCAAGSPSGALLTVHWGADGEITETALLIEGV